MPEIAADEPMSAEALARYIRSSRCWAPSTTGIARPTAERRVARGRGDGADDPLA